MLGLSWNGSLYYTTKKGLSEKIARLQESMTLEKALKMWHKAKWSIAFKMIITPLKAKAESVGIKT